MRKNYIFLLIILFGLFLFLASFPFRPEKGEEGLREIKLKRDKYRILNKSSGCFTDEIQKGTSYSYKGGKEKVKTVIKTPNPCYKLKSLNLSKIGENLTAYIKLKQEPGICVQCIGYYKIIYEVNISEKLKVESITQILKGKKRFKKNKTKNRTTKNRTLKNKTKKSFCGRSTGGFCSKDKDCIESGCNGEICQSVDEKPIMTPCVYKECYNNEKYGLKCKCVENKCQWTRASSLKPLK